MNADLLLDDFQMSRLKNVIPKREALGDLATLFSVISDISRIRILSALAIRNMCVTDLSNVLSMNQTTLSHQLKYLKSIKILQAERSGKNITYSIANQKINNIMLSGIDYLGY